MTKIALTTAVAFALFTLLACTQNTPTTPQPGLPLTLEVFGDFNCPHCARFVLLAEPELRRTFHPDRELRIVHRHYPFLTETSHSAAKGAECARAQQKGPSYIHAAYLRRADGGAPLTDTGIEDAALAAGADAAKWQACMDTESPTEQVIRDLEDGKKRRAPGAPALFLQGRLLNWESCGDLVEQITRALREETGAEQAQ